MVSTVMNESLRTALKCADCVATVVLRKQLNFKSRVIRSTIFLVYIFIFYFLTVRPGAEHGSSFTSGLYTQCKYGGPLGRRPGRVA